MAQTLCDKRSEIFELQDPENGLFDVTFEVEEKLIFAHKFMLVSVSETFNAMFSATWNNGEKIEIKTNLYADFYDFLKFIYSGRCNFNDENIFTIVDIAEFYQVKALHQKCDEYLSQKEYTSADVKKLFKILSKYFHSLPLFVTIILETIKERRLSLIKLDATNFCNYDRIIGKEEWLFKTIYEWAEHQAIEKQEETNVDNFKLNDAIKAEIADFLPYFRVDKMCLGFLRKYLDKTGFIFSYKSMNDFLNVNYAIVKITNSYEESLWGLLTGTRSISNIKVVTFSKYGKPYKNDDVIKWRTKFQWFSSLVKKRDGVEWYLSYSDNGYFEVKTSAAIKSEDYLIAEMEETTSDFDIPFFRESLIDRILSNGFSIF